MTISPDLIVRALQHASFRLSYFSESSGLTVVARRVRPDLFERVGVSRATQRQGGRELDRVSAFVQSSVVPGRTAVKGLAVSEHLPLPSCDVRGHSTVSNENDASRWLEEVSATAPTAASAARLRYGEALLAATSQLREAGDAYMQRLPAGKSMTAVLEVLRLQATDSQHAEAVAWKQDRICLIPNGGVWYEAACLLIAIYQDQVENPPARFLGRRADDAQDRELMLRLQYLASRIANEAGWQWPLVQREIERE
jgi:hypothetical protein